MTYELEFTEKWVCRLTVEAGSRKEAIEKANKTLNEGSYAWQSTGIVRMAKCRRIPEKEAKEHER